LNSENSENSENSASGKKRIGNSYRVGEIV
jgi:hypothetical protein